MRKLKDLLPFVSYTATLVLMKKNEMGRYEPMFSPCELIRRATLEDCYPHLLDLELADGVHGEGIRDGLYIHLK